MKLRAKLLLVTVPLIVFPLLVLSVVAYWQLHRQASGLKFQVMSAVMGDLQRELDGLLASNRANLQLFANSVLLRRYLAAGATDGHSLQPALIQEFRGYQQIYPRYREIQVLLPDGQRDIRVTTAGTDPGARGIDSGWLDSLGSLAPGESAERFLHETGTGKPVLRMGLGIFLTDPREDPVLGGFLVLSVELEFPVRQAREGLPGELRILYLDRAGRGLLPASPTPDPALRAVVVGAAASGAVLATRYQDRAVRLQARRLHPDLYLVGYVPESALLAASHRLRNLGLLILLGATGLTVILLVAFQQRVLLEPVQALHRAMLDYARNPCQLPTPPTGRDEIASLGRAFVEMAGSLRRSHERISFLAYHDGLTGLPNRVYVQEYLVHALARTRRTGCCLGLFFLDLDGFKLVNDSLGHHMGDELLKAVGNNLLGCLRGEDVVSRGDGVAVPSDSRVLARLGGDEFLIVVNDMPGEEAVERVAERLLRTLAVPFRIDGEEFTVSASIGVALGPEHSTDPEALIQYADMAMYDAKAQGRNTYRLYRSVLNTETVWRRRVETRLRRALEAGELMLHYQPQVAVADGRVVGCEALLRWHDAELGWVSPARFIPVIEQTGLIRPVSEWVFAEACRQARVWREAGLGELEMGVNLSAAHLDSPDLVTGVARVLADSGLAPHQLLLELTETSVMSGQQTGLGVLQGLRALGVGIALDDFGTGYSSLSYLRRFPIDCLKIDQSFLANLADRADAALVATIVAMGRGLGFEVVAEGVETQEQLDFLQAHGCHRAQGYLFSPPLTAAEFEHWLARRTRMAPVCLGC